MSRVVTICSGCTLTVLGLAGFVIAPSNRYMALALAWATLRVAALIFGGMLLGRGLRNQRFPDPRKPGHWQVMATSCARERRWALVGIALDIIALIILTFGRNGYDDSNGTFVIVSLLTVAGSILLGWYVRAINIERRRQHERAP